jgi:hypothetical protein
VIGSLPTGSVDVVTVTVPVVGLTEPDPRLWPPLVTVTVPVVPTGKVTVIVTGLPKVLGPDVVTVTGGVCLLTVCTTDAVAVLLLASPLYAAVIVSPPTGSVDEVIVATPFVTVDVPRTVVPFVKVTVPVVFVGSVAVKVTD